MSLMSSKSVRTAYKEANRLRRDVSPSAGSVTSRKQPSCDVKIDAGDFGGRTADVHVRAFRRRRECGKCVSAVSVHYRERPRLRHQIKSCDIPLQKV